MDLSTGWLWSCLRPLLLLVFVGLLYSTLLTIYRVWLSPLSRFPGPKLAAATQWYETYYEMYHRGGGMFTKHIKDLHAQYGPIVRINPHELHIDDPEYYENIYAPSAHADKLKVFERRFNIPTAAFSTASHVLHKHRRNALAPFFTKSKIQAHSASIQRVVDRICQRLTTEYQGKTRPVALNHMFATLSGDVITSLAFGEEAIMCDAEDFITPWTRGMISLVSSTHITTQFPIMVPVTNLIPDSVLLKDPNMGPIVQFRHSLDQRIDEVFERRKSGKEQKAGTLFDTLLDSFLPPEELSKTRMQHEAVSIIGAAFDTTRQALTMITFHIINRSATYQKLRAELQAAIPDSDNIPSWTELQTLPYLSACIEEGLRIGYGTVQRSPRIFSTPLQYQGQIIPPGTPVSTDSYHMHSNPSVFPDPDAYIPERWLGNPKGPDGRKQLSRYMVAFGRGTRMCLGMQMAYCEMFLMVASLFRRFDMELHETDRSDVDFYVDYLTPQPRPESKGVRILIC